MIFTLIWDPSMRQGEWKREKWKKMGMSQIRGFERCQKLCSYYELSIHFFFMLRSTFFKTKTSGLLSSPKFQLTRKIKKKKKKKKKSYISTIQIRCIDYCNLVFIFFDQRLDLVRKLKERKERVSHVGKC